MAAPRPRRWSTGSSACRARRAVSRPRAAGVRSRRRAARRPALILVDELAHSNAPGSRHPKRWQDIQELQAAGIDVWTTVNVQHLDSLNQAVGGITGVRVWETVPDAVFDGADEVVLVDLPADELLRRLREGKVYLPEQARHAARNFFRKGNLIALRELALRRTADRVDDDVRAYRHARRSNRYGARARRCWPASAPATTPSRWCAARAGWRASSIATGMWSPSPRRA
jgi:K+-sensing histidine kinase KdpD